MSFSETQAKNPQLLVRTVDEEAFRPYGMVIEGLDLEKLCAAARAAAGEAAENRYVASLPELEATQGARHLSRRVYGDLPVQTGFCAGSNKRFANAEYHQGSETVVAATECVLFLGKRQDIRGDRYDLGRAEAFFMRPGQAVELYATTLHHMPCATDRIFVTAVLLPRGANAPLAKPEGLYWAKNNWFLTHPSETATVAAGAFPGLAGEIPFLR